MRGGEALLPLLPLDKVSSLIVRRLTELLPGVHEEIEGKEEEGLPEQLS